MGLPPSQVLPLTFLLFTCVSASIYCHRVTELVEGDSSRKIVEIICRTSWLKSEGHCGRIERVLKVHNMQKTLARFEEYREMVKIKANELPKKHPRCLADGNELLRFYGTSAYLKNVVYAGLSDMGFLQRRK
ncbi:hypothetical protein EJ110_NYTH29527 [Nymphaea thermarum]|nr:hypothetical protein EJ110_NYTH29527 [Nymphaea thermarum]